MTATRHERLVGGIACILLRDRDAAFRRVAGLTVVHFFGRLVLPSSEGAVNVLA